MHYPVFRYSNAITSSRQDKGIFKMHKSNTFRILGALAFVLSNSATAAIDHCDLHVASSDYLIDGRQLDVGPGDVVCLEAGSRGPMRITNFAGTEDNPVIITNSNGTVRTTPYEYSIAIEQSSHVKLLSTETEPTDPYKIELGGTLSIGKLSHNITIEGIEIYRARFAGMLIKTDPNCDERTWRENFLMTGIVIRGNYIHHTEEGEGMYVGYTGKSRTLECNGVSTTVYPHQLEGVTIENNRLEFIAADGIQLNSVKGDAQIINNKVFETGVSPFSPHWQNTGIQVGGDHVIVEGNVLYRTGGNGMMLDGDGLKIRQNKILYAGENGIFSRNAAMQDASMSGGEPHEYVGNWIIGSGSYALTNYAVNTIEPHLITQNTIEYKGGVDAAGRPFVFSFLNDSVSRDERENVVLVRP